MFFDKRYISANETETDQVEIMFAITPGEMYLFGLCLHLLSDVFLHGYSRSLVGPQSQFGSVRCFC